MATNLKKIKNKSNKLPNNTKQLSFYKNHSLVKLAIILLTINSLLIFALFKINNLQNQQNTIINLGSKKTYNGITISASNIKTESGYVMGLIPSNNEKMISVWLSIKNDSAKDFDFYPSIQAFVRDDQGITYNMQPVELIKPFIGGVIKPGQKADGQLSFNVTNRDLPLFLYVESRQKGGAPFVFNIQ